MENSNSRVVPVLSQVIDFLNNLRESTSCEETKEKIRSFIQQDDLLEREKAA